MINRTKAKYLAGSFLFFLLFLAQASFAAKIEYILRPGDVISINVIEHAEFSQKAKIRPDGMINYPVIGEVDVAGKSTSQLVKVMEEKLAPYINNVVVNVNIESYFSNKIYILGDVFRSGEFEIFEPIDIIRALALAGGLKDQSVKQLRVVRANGDVYSIDMTKFFTQRSGKGMEAYILYPGDTLFVPESFKIPWAAISVILSTIYIALLVSNFFTSR